MFLFDTNIFLEILLSQDKSSDCKEFMNNYSDQIYISDFSFHSIGVILFRLNKEMVFNNFLNDVLPKIDIVSLSTATYSELYNIKTKYNLDFDDCYQFKIAKDNNLTIVTMDKDFQNINDEVEIKFI